MIFSSGQRIVFIGDSITDCGRRGAHKPYGDGYVDLVRSFVTARRPEVKLSWLNRGVGGDTVRDLAARWDADAIGTAPDWLSVMIGINDVWHAFGSKPRRAVPIDEYATTLRALLRRAVDATGCRLIVAEPYIIEPDRAEPQRALSDRYCLAAREIAAEFQAVGVRTQDAFDDVLRSTVPADWADDRIHPHRPGHAVIAQAFLTAIGVG
ncbi:SGNH/GDSL hydrolase family protein [Actinoplanes sp. N902-109]|uniref:SGNH/GDSL hydrolase family protein n=1 Tax=Actinoplanes sp. (strain N902-109) TaxID=649831 RepID=UPI000329410C|nr:SGNH/GDSL hydrolase family protein [Actinoplanes sp. N902-109]AGL14267.1 lipolytic enzyme [Actinoplanes sp. N902-109]